MISFRVIGEPAPQGSKRHVGHGVMIESSKKVKPWREAVANAASLNGHGGMALGSPLSVHLHFALSAPTSLSKKKLALGPCRKPDLDKLVRSTFDGLTDAGVWADDARVVELHASKRFCEPGEERGCLVRIEFPKEAKP